MENEKENTNFVNFGTYRAEEADILKQELEKDGIPVKVRYPGTEIGREATANVYFPAYQLMIRVCDFQKAKELRKKFNIKPIEDGEKMPLPKSRIWAKKGLTKYFLIAYLLSFIALFITDYLSDEFGILPENTSFYFMILVFVCFFLWLGSLVYHIFHEKRKGGIN